MLYTWTDNGTNGNMRRMQHCFDESQGCHKKWWFERQTAMVDQNDLLPQMRKLPLHNNGEFRVDSWAQHMLEIIVSSLSPKACFMPGNFQSNDVSWWPLKHPLRKITYRSAGSEPQCMVYCKATIAISRFKGCLAVDKDGYLKVVIGRHDAAGKWQTVWESAHRLVLWALLGPPPLDSTKGTWLVMHSCNNKHCLSPAHLFYGNQKENKRGTICDAVHSWKTDRLEQLSNMQ